MANGRCYYTYQELLAMIQILILKGFGFSLEKIQSIVKERARYKLCALKAQKMVLLREQEQLQKNLQLIDLMIQQSNQEDKIMQQDAQMYLETMKNKQAYVQYFDESYMKAKTESVLSQFRSAVGEAYFQEVHRRGSQSSLVDAQIYGQRYGQFVSKMHEAMDQRLDVHSEAIEALLIEQWDILKMVYPDTSSKTIYLAIRDILCTQPEEKNQAAQPLFDYLSLAMEAFADKRFE
jgi:DNA-binding transcriptional MerR regulator